MKKIMMILAASIIATSLPAMAADHAQSGHDANCIKDCQMLVKNCGNEVDTLQQRISRLNQEIGRGTATYSLDQLRALERKLQDTQETLAGLTTGA